MVALYAWDAQGVYSAAVECDPSAPLPPNTTPTKPPALTGSAVAQWAGTRWVVLSSRPTPPYAAPKRDEVDAERDRRISLGFAFGGNWYQSRLPSAEKSGDWEVFSGKALEALIAIMAGAKPGDLRWSDPLEDFAWIAADNSRVPMDAHMVIELAKAASAHRTRHTFAGSDIKALSPIPADFADDKWWQ